MNYRTDIQGLRAIAILLVLGCHWQVPFMTNGYIGVDIFFVISGFLITGLLAKPHATLVAFYAGRFIRLLPALIFMLVIICSLSYFLLPPYEQIKQGMTANLAVIWMSNFHFAFSKISYFNTDGQDLFMHTWSLGVEEQFYLIWPLILFLVVYFKKDKPVGVILTIAVSTFLLAIYFSSNFSIESYYMMPSRIWQFACGAIAFFLTEKIKYKFNSWLFGSLFIFAVGIFYLMPNFLIVNTLFVVICTAYVLCYSSSNINTINLFLCNRYLVWIGNRSYSIYLWHWPLWVFLNSIAILNGYKQFLVLVIATIIMAEFSFRYIEIPIRKNQSLRIRPRLVFYGSTAIVAVFIISVLFWFGQLKPGAEKSYLNELYGYNNDMPRIYKDGCDEKYESTRVKPCIYKFGNYTKTIVLVGDSVGVQWFSSLYNISSERNFRLIVYTKSACPILDVKKYYSRIGRIFTECEIWREEVLLEISKLNPDVVFIGSGLENVSKTEWINGLESVLHKLFSSSRRFVVISPTPELSQNPLNCLMRKAWISQFVNASMVCSSIKTRFTIQTNDAHKWNLEAAGHFKNVFVLSLNDLVCAKNNCSSTEVGVVKFRDNKHLTNSYIEKISESVERRLNAYFEE